MKNKQIQKLSKSTLSKVQGGFSGPSGFKDFLLSADGSDFLWADFKDAGAGVEADEIMRDALNTAYEHWSALHPGSPDWKASESGVQTSRRSYGHFLDNPNDYRQIIKNRGTQYKDFISGL